MERREYVRCKVLSWDNQTITAQTREGVVSIDYGQTCEERDLRYLQRMLRQGMQLNLLDCGLNGSVLVPRLVVVEPDFLIDISAVAACFTTYGHHPLLYTVNRLREHPVSQSALLGNFAGAALDDIIAHEQLPFKDMLRRSFREQALRFCACEGFHATRFKQEAMQQVQNLQDTVSNLFVLEHFNRSKALLEPSFVCERLGLQGRVDLMTSDLRLLVEQKSGKNMKIEHDSHDPNGQQKQDHYVQLLLYYGILRHNFGQTEQEVDMRLLYSRYPAQQGLLKVGYHRQLFAEALQLRNQIVATELLIAREGFGRIAPLLTPAVIYKDVKPDGYFHQYVQPELQKLSDRLAGMKPVERAYYERMMTFVYREQACQKTGATGQPTAPDGTAADVWQQYHNGAASNLWQLSLKQKLMVGSIYHNLTVASYQRSGQYGGYDLVTLNTDSTDGEVKDFRRGDMVWLYAYEADKKEPDVRNSILYKGTLEAVTTDLLTVRLNNGQQNEETFRQHTGWRWAIEHGNSDLSISACLRSLHQFITNPTAQGARRRDLLLGQREPQADRSLRLSRSYGEDYDPLLTKVKQARDYFLLVGPPGTGKTSQALRFMVSEALNGCEDSKVTPSLLLTAYTNRAVDEICAMLDTESWSYLRLGNEAVCDPRYRQHLLEASLSTATKLDDIRAHISNIPIVVGTTSTLIGCQELFLLKHFTLAIVDEASQILEPNIVGLLDGNHIDRFVLVGDHKQLPAVVQQSEEQARVSEPCLHDIGLTDCRQSLFERLLNWERSSGRTQFVGSLYRQGRMHPEVARFASENFYAAERLQPVPLPHQEEEGLGYEAPAEDALDELLKQRRVLYLDAREWDSCNAAIGPDLTDRREAALVASLLVRIHRFYGSRFSPETTVGVIVPYRYLIGLIRQELKHYDNSLLQQVCIDTVERYQGSQRDVIIYAFGISQSYQLDFLTANTFMEDGHPIDRKLNVAMTRARRQLIMTGRTDLLRESSLFREIISQYGTDSTKNT